MAKKYRRGGEDVLAVVVSAIRFLVNDLENAALQAYWTDRSLERSICQALVDARETIARMSSGSSVRECPWECPQNTCRPNCRLRPPHEGVASKTRKTN
jgi:hypothetical protein